MAGRPPKGAVILVDDVDPGDVAAAAVDCKEKLPILGGVSGKAPEKSGCPANPGLGSLNEVKTAWGEAAKSPDGCKPEEPGNCKI